MKKISILIRHKEGREKEFERCINSIYGQTYKNYQIIVSLESEEQFASVQPKPHGLGGWIVVTDKFIKVPHQHYNLHMNNLKAEVKEGWFFPADDDDYLASPTVLEELSKHLFEGALIVQFLRKDNRGMKGNDVIKPTDKMIERGIIKKGVIGGGCLVLHHSFKDVADWLPHKGADYDYIKAVTDKVPTKFVKLVLQISEKANLGL